MQHEETRRHRDNVPLRSGPYENEASIAVVAIAVLGMGFLLLHALVDAAASGAGWIFDTARSALGG